MSFKLPDFSKRPLPPTPPRLSQNDLSRSMQSLSQQGSATALSRSSQSASSSPRGSTAGLNSTSSHAKKENVLVAVRVRPLSISEVNTNQASIWDVIPGQLGRITMNKEWRDRLRKTSTNDEYFYGNFHSRYILTCR